MKKKNNWGLLLLLLLMVGTGWFILREQPISSLIGLLSQVEPHYILLGLGLMVAFVGCEALCTKLVLSRLGHKAPYHRCMGYSFTGFYFSSITPSATGGQPAQVYYMSRDGVPAAHGTLDMLLVTLCYQVATLLCAAAAFLLKPSLLHDMGGGLGVLMVFGASTTLALTAAIVFVMFAPNAAAGFAGKILDLLVRVHLVKDENGMRERLVHQMSEYRRGAECLKTHPELLPAMLGLSLLQMLAIYAVPFVVYRSFGLAQFSAVDLIGMQALLTVAVATLPLPGAMGASEGGFIRSFTLFFGAGLVTPAMLVSRGISFYSFLLISGGITLFVHLRSRKRADAGEMETAKPEAPVPPSVRRKSPALHITAAVTAAVTKTAL